MARVLVGRVVSDKGDKTIAVAIQSAKTHELYKKQYSRVKRFLAHDPKNEAHPGDKVSIIEVRPMSARKRFALQKILERPLISEDAAAVITAEPEQLEKSKEEKVKPEPKTRTKLTDNNEAQK